MALAHSSSLAYWLLLKISEENWRFRFLPEAPGMWLRGSQRRIEAEPQGGCEACQVREKISKENWNGGAKALTPPLLVEDLKRELKRCNIPQCDQPANVWNQRISKENWREMTVALTKHACPTCSEDLKRELKVYWSLCLLREMHVRRKISKRELKDSADCHWLA